MNLIKRKSNNIIEKLKKVARETVEKLFKEHFVSKSDITLTAGDIGQALIILISSLTADFFYLLSRV